MTLSTPSSQSLQSYCIAIITVAVLTFMVYWLRPVLVPFVVALFVVSGITPILETVERYLQVNRLVASVIAFVFGILLLGILSVCLWASVQQLAIQGNAYRARIIELLATVQSWLPADFAGMTVPGAEDVPSDQDVVAAPQGKTPSTLIDETLADAVPKFEETTQTDLSSFRSEIDKLIRLGLAKVSSAFFEFFSTSVVVLIYVFFLILGSANSNRLELSSIRAVDQQVRSYLFLKTIISIATGFVFGLALWMLGVPMALTFGLLAFLLNYIPNVGPVVASLLPIPFILLSPEGSALWMVAAISITTAIQVVSGSVIEPKLMGESSDMHPVVILLALMFWGMMWGITGMFLATPITAGIKIVLEGYSTTKPVADILAGRFDSIASQSQGTV